MNLQRPTPTFFVLMALIMMGFTIPSISEACPKHFASKSSDSKHRKAGKKKINAGLKKKSTKIASSSRSGRGKITPPARVRIIDTGSKSESQTFDMPVSMDEFQNSQSTSRGVAAVTKAPPPQMIRQIETPSQPIDEFDAFEAP